MELSITEWRNAIVYPLFYVQFRYRVIHADGSRVILSLFRYETSRARKIIFITWIFVIIAYSPMFYQLCKSVSYASKFRSFLWRLCTAQTQAGRYDSISITLETSTYNIMNRWKDSMDAIRFAAACDVFVASSDWKVYNIIAWSFENDIEMMVEIPARLYTDVFRRFSSYQFCLC